MEDEATSNKQKYAELQRKWRFVFLILVCFVEFGRFYCIHLPSLQKEIIAVCFQWKHRTTL